MRRWLYRAGPLLAWLAVLVPLVALARVGGGQHYERAQPDKGDPNGSGGDDSGLILAIVELTIHYPQIMCPLLLLCGLGYFFYQRANNPTSRTQRALEEREADARTSASDAEVADFVAELKATDPQFDAAVLLEKIKRIFVDTQQAWFRRDLSRVRPFLSDAMHQRLLTQLQLLASQGVRNAISDVQVLDAQLIGLERSEWFDTLRVRLRAQMRDVDVPAQSSDEQALAAAAKATPEPFVEVWSFVRKPGVATKIGTDVYQGKCPNCGAPFKGGAANNCEFCGAIVNSGNYDWTLSEITQGIEYARYEGAPDGLREARAADPGLNVEILQDRASLIFWKWIDAECRGEPQRLAKLATPELLATLDTQPRPYLEAAVGAVSVRTLHAPAGAPQAASKEPSLTPHQEAHVEIRWSARQGSGPTVPQRWVFSLRRGAGAKTNTGNGMSTSRCPNCNAPLGNSLTASCDYCGFRLDTGEKDWVLEAAVPVEHWSAATQTRFQRPAPSQKVSRPDAGEVLDAQERERLLYMMAAIAAADGVVTDDERQMLQLFSHRWSVPWEKVEMALAAGPKLFERLIPQRGSPEAEFFLKSLVSIALVDGKVDRAERRMLEAAAEQLGLMSQLRQMLGHA